MAHKKMGLCCRAASRRASQRSVCQGMLYHLTSSGFGRTYQFSSWKVSSSTAGAS
jgi:hypothetical protein